MKLHSTIVSLKSELNVPDIFREKVTELKGRLKHSVPVIPSVLETIEHNSSETFMTGKVELGIMNDRLELTTLNVPVIARFLFTFSNQTKPDPSWLTCLS